MKLRWKDLKKGAKKAEWRGTLLCRELEKHLWEVRQDWVDPVRLYIPQLNLEFAYGFMQSDGPSIPTLVCMMFGRKREDLIKSGFLHDYGYEHAELFVRQPDEEWGTVKLDKKSIDVLLRIGCLAEDATDWQADLIYWGVRTKIGEKAWKKCRKLDEKIKTMCCSNDEYTKKRCPGCGSFAQEQVLDFVTSCFKIRCRNCLAHTDCYSTINQAVKAWDAGKVSLDNDTSDI